MLECLPQLHNAPASAGEGQFRASGVDLVRRPWPVLLGAALVGVFVYGFWFLHVFQQAHLSAGQWALSAWNPENNQEHSILVLPIALFLAWYHRDRLAAAPKQPDRAGLLVVLAGLGLFLLAVRTLQPRVAVLSLPVLVLGCALYLWGRATARVLLFPALFLLFMIPVGGLVQGTVSLQLLVSSAVQGLSSLIGVKIQMIGTSLKALDNSFDFEIVEGCSGIRSLMAMTMLSALYVHFTQQVLWKQLVIFAASILFALIGNIGRIFTVVLVARFIDPKLAGGIYHDYSGFIFFPLAVAAMASFSKLLNLRFESLRQALPAEDSSIKGRPAPISYDY